MLKILNFLLFCGFAGFLFSQAALQLLSSIESPFADDTNSWSWYANIKGGGDINGDGYDDIVLAGKPLGSVGGRRAVYIYLGGSTLNSEPDYIIPDPSGAQSFSNFNTFGKTIAYNADLNGDGYCDLVISDSDYGLDGWGRVYIYFGGPDFDTNADLILEGYNYCSKTQPLGLSFGFIIDTSGDFNSDGYNDLVISSEHADLSHNGHVDIFYGGPDFDALRDWHYYGEMVENFAASLSVGDLNGDGFSDLATMSSYYGSMENQNQELKLFLGGHDFDNQVDACYEFAQDYTHAMMLMNADLDHDGFDDLVLQNSVSKILYGSTGFPDELEDLILPDPLSYPATYVVSNDSTFIWTKRSGGSQGFMEHRLVSLNSEGQFVTDYQLLYYPQQISGCGFGYPLGDVNNDGNIEILVTNRVNDTVVFNIMTTHFNPDSVEDAINQPAVNLSASPNPFKTLAKLSYELKEPDKVSLSVYNLKGQLITNLDAGDRGSGQHSVLWDGRDNMGHKLPSGVYLLRLKLGEKSTVSKKVTLCH